MDSVRFALCAAVAAVAVCAGPAHASDGPATMSGTIELTPVTSRPGAEVQLRVSGCRSERATATSEAFVSDARLAKDSAGLFAEATIRKTVGAGTYPVVVNCDGYNATALGRLTVVTDGRELPETQPATDVRDARPARGEHRQAATPVAPVPAGGGGTAHAAAAEAPGTPGLVLAGTTAAIAGGLIWYRRRTNAELKAEQNAEQPES
ncbi:hypothetical protein FHS39_001227 [Streptomyces olivoverticillatus]|uniref:Lipoprotein n=1 Tax=Streptomyces olivoverticillatus TaxID=66427 RepID=A0A7W7LMD0_9ACTN|nr:hypothetical protein [Streptomyces olivoverticillatus]MBB4892216.1 hypothetical protein [Streptomyces olivoverticillatus]